MEQWTDYVKILQNICILLTNVYSIYLLLKKDKDNQDKL